MSPLPNVRSVFFTPFSDHAALAPHGLLRPGGRVAAGTRLLLEGYSLVRTATHRTEPKRNGRISEGAAKRWKNPRRRSLVPSFVGVSSIDDPDWRGARVPAVGAARWTQPPRSSDWRPTPAPSVSQQEVRSRRPTHRAKDETRCLPS